MAGFSTFIIFTSVLCQLPVTATSGPLKEVVGALGGSVTFTVSFPEKQIDTVIWTFNTFTVAIVNKDNAKVLQNPKKEKILFPDGSYSMKLSQLKKNDSGVYRAEIHSTSLQSPFTQEYVLYVYETLSAPKVTTDEQPSKNGSCTTKLTCSVEEEGDNVTYSWKAIGQGAHELHDGAILPISWKLGEKEKTLICMARNPISHSSSNPVLARNLCEDTANLDKSSPRFILYTLPVAIVFSLTLIIAFAVRTEKGKGSKKDTERVDNFCPLEENTEYATIPYINERSLEDDAANTLYSTVQIPKAVKSPSYLPAEPPMWRQLSFENII